MMERTLKIKPNLNKDLVELDIEFENKNIGKLEIPKSKIFDFFNEFLLVLEDTWMDILKLIKPKGGKK